MDGIPRGFFTVSAEYRDGMGDLMGRLRRVYGLGLLSGDTDAERTRMHEIFGPGAELRFRQSPAAKIAMVRETQAHGGRILVVGDGLNDAGALQQADVGVSVTDDIAAFTPACDAILEGDKLASLDRFLGFSRMAVRIVLLCFAISLVYNVIGLVFAFSGTLSPLIAAILMPVSSITVVAVATLATRQLSRRWGLL
jgi:Cu+-exporting ATPase